MFQIKVDFFYKHRRHFSSASSLGVGLLFPNCNLWLIELVEVSKRGKTIGGITSLIFYGQFISRLVITIFIAKFSLTN